MNTLTLDDVLQVKTERLNPTEFIIHSSFHHEGIEIDPETPITNHFYIIEDTWGNQRIIILKNEEELPKDIKEQHKILYHSEQEEQ